jgi:hypothetical protein
MANKFINPPDEVANALNETLKKLYPNDTKTHKSIDYKKGGENCLFKATVTFYWADNSSMALFEYKESDTNREYYWYCSHDWND